MPGCRVCGACGNHPRYLAREMMLGLKNTFEYFQCGACGCLQIAKPPSDLSEYYPADYYSFAKVPNSGPLKRCVKRLWASHILGAPNLPGALLSRRYGVPPVLDWVKRAGVRRHQSILDVGCGSGHLLQSLNEAGFSRLLGMDPFLDQDTCGRNGVRILKRTLEEMDGVYDFIMLNHSFEHMENPLAALKHVHRLLRQGCVALLRLPVADGYAWHTYGIHWVQLDAPRHLFLHTERSLRLLVERASLQIEQVVHDSTAFQFWGSEQYRQDIPLRDERSYAVNPGGAKFAKEDMEQFELMAARLNAKGEGDQACFYLRKVDG